MLYIDTYCPFLSRTCELILWKQSPFVLCFTVFSHYSLQFQLKNMCILKCVSFVFKGFCKKSYKYEILLYIIGNMYQEIKVQYLYILCWSFIKKGEVIYTLTNFR